MAAAPLAAAAIAGLEAARVDTTIDTVVDPGALTRTAVVPLRCVNVFANPGLVWHRSAIDQAGIAITDQSGVVGDQRPSATAFADRVGSGAPVRNRTNPTSD